MTAEVTVTVRCRDRVGIVALIAAFLAQRGLTIQDSQQFGDVETGQFFMRTHAVAERTVDVELLRAEFGVSIADLEADWRIHDAADRHRLLVMVSRQEHCLSDLLHRVRSGLIRADIVAVVSNHDDLRPLVEWHSIPFHHVAVDPAAKAEAEDELRKLVTAYDAETVVLARYMQILSDPLCSELAGRAINIHHSLLPSFKGARPYAQAHSRGVKVIGATAHYVTAELDEGPIIDQDFVRVNHTRSAADLTAIGQDLEAIALGRAVKAHVEHRVLVNGTKTVVFD